MTDSDSEKKRQALKIANQRKLQLKIDAEAKKKAAKMKSAIIAEMTIMWSTLKAHAIQKMASVTFMLAASNIILLLLVFLLATRDVETRILTTNAAMQVVEVPAVKKSMYDDVQAKQYAVDALVHFFSLHQDSFRRELSEAGGKYFVPGALEVFTKGLDDMGLLSFLKDGASHKGATISLSVDGPAILLDSNLNNTLQRHQWIFRIPTAITLADAYNSKTTKQIFTLTLIRLNINEKIDGIGVMKVVSN